MRRIAVMAMLLLAVLVGAGSYGTPVLAEGVNQPQEQTNQEVSKETKKKVVKVQPGDSLSKLGKRTHTNYKRIYYANKKIKNPNLIYPGQKLRIPNKDEKLKPRSFGRSAPTHAVHNTSFASPRVSTPVTHAVYSGGPTVWDRLAACESGGNWAINTGNGYYGGLQFTLGSWQAVGGTGYPNQASRAEQIKRGQILQARSGWGNWPACAAKLGLT